MRKALINKDGEVVNVININNDSVWKHPKEHRLLTEEQSRGANIGDTWDGSHIVPKPQPEPSPPPRDLAAEIDALDARVKSLEK
tara:strand:+ start:2936 stop:3187 length:252 start_codon:yes stop_codon:yes gene_type:complete